jgi:hypothetical protein
MDQQAFLQNLRTRTAQLLTWFIGSTQTREQYQHSDRQQADGFLRSHDDPDVRQRSFAGQDAGLTFRERFQGWVGSQSSPSGTHEAQRQHLERQQREQQQRQQQGGWGHGR